MQINYKSHSLAIPKVHSLQYPGCQRVFFLLLAAKIERRNFRCQRIVLETCFRNGCSFAVMDLSYTLYLFVSVFIIILPLNFRPCPRGFSLAVVVWRGTEKYHLSLSSTWKAIAISRPTHTFFLGKLRIHCLISPILFFIAEKRDLCDFLTCDKTELDHSLLLARNTFKRTSLPFFCH